MINLAVAAFCTYAAIYGFANDVPVFWTALSGSFAVTNLGLYLKG